MNAPAFTIKPVRSAADLRATAILIQDYVRALGVDLAFQSFEAELRGLPGKYAPPDGALLLARMADGMAAGCVALRRLDDAGRCEMKRLYAAPAARGAGVGRALVGAIVDTARRLGYREMRLDSMASLTAALALYRAAGFVPIPAYCENPFADAVFLSLDLTV